MRNPTYQPFASKMREDLLKSLKLISAAEGRSLQSLLEEAVAQYLSNRRFSQETSEIHEKAARYSVSFDVMADKQGNSGENTGD